MHNTYCVETVCINHIENNISRHVENVLQISRCVENVLTISRHVESHVENFRACFITKKTEKTPLCFDFVVLIYTIFCTSTSYEHFQNIMLNST